MKRVRDPTDLFQNICEERIAMNVKTVCKKTRTVYKLRLDSAFLAFEEHGNDTQIFIPANDLTPPACFNTQEAAIAAVCESFYFHHGCDSILPTDSAKDRLSKIELVRTTIVEEEEVIEPEIYIPTNIEVYQWYVAEGDSGLQYYLKSQVPDWQERANSVTHFYDDDGYEFAEYADRIKGYNAWVAAGKPVSPTCAN